MPASPSNARTIYFLGQNGELRGKMDLGPGCAQLESVVEQIEIIDATTVRLRYRLDSSSWGQNNKKQAESVIELRYGHSRVLSATFDGNVVIKDGVVTSTGDPVPAVEKCAEPDVSS
jgi:hypothetical protein